jgi:hypothetical protein
MDFALWMTVYISGAALNPTKPKQEGRIFKGEEARITDFPYQVSLSHLCLVGWSI